MIIKNTFLLKDQKQLPITFILVLLFSLNSFLFAVDTLIWQDEFDGATLNTYAWTRQNLPGADTGNNQLEYNTTREANSYIDNGNLVIKAIDEDYSTYHFTSARLNTRDKLSYKYGLLEARIKVPNLADGLWPAFWMMGDSDVGWPGCGEIDILEMGFTESRTLGQINKRVTSTAHWENANAYAGYGLSTVASQDLYNDYHVITVDWTPTYIKTYLDRTTNPTAFWTINISGGAGSDLEEFHQPFYILLNLAVGGGPTGITNYANITAPFPALMYVDWIRLYDNGYTTDLILPPTTTPEPTPYGDNVITNGTFGDSNGWTGPITMGTYTSDTTYNYNYSTDFPAEGTTPCLRLTHGAANCNSAIYQTLTLHGGSTYKFDGLIKESNSSSNKFWIEFYLTSIMPVENGTDITAGTNTTAMGIVKPAEWGGVDNYNGKLSDLAESNAPPLFVVSGTGDRTYYLVLKSGTSGGSMDFVIDNLTLNEANPDIPTPSPTPTPTVVPLEINYWIAY